MTIPNKTNPKRGCLACQGIKSVVKEISSPKILKLNKKSKHSSKKLLSNSESTLFSDKSKLVSVSNNFFSNSNLVKSNKKSNKIIKKLEELFEIQSNVILFMIICVGFFLTFI